MIDDSTLLTTSEEEVQDTATDETSSVATEELERPEWLKEKYDNVEAQAQAYNSLESKLGGFTGAPEKYEFHFPEEVQGEFDYDSPLMQNFSQIATDLNMSQDAAQTLMDMYINDQNTQRIDPQAEMQKIGIDAGSRATKLGDWAKQHLTNEEFQTFSGMGTTADNFLLLERLVKGVNKEISVTRNDNSSSQTSTSSVEELNQLVNEEYHTNPVYRKKVDAKFKEFYGE